MGDIRLGCKRDAAKAIRGELARIGNGASRVTFVNARGNLVYKVCRYHEDYPECQCWDNRDEAARAASLRAEGHVNVAMTTSWKIGGWTVNCQPAVRATGKHLSTYEYDAYNAKKGEALMLMHSAGIFDDHDGNWGVSPTGDVVLFDLN